MLNFRVVIGVILSASTLVFEAESAAKKGNPITADLGGELPGHHGRKPLLATFDRRNPAPNMKDILVFIRFHI